MRQISLKSLEAFLVAITAKHTYTNEHFFRIPKLRGNRSLNQEFCILSQFSIYFVLA